MQPLPCTLGQALTSPLFGMASAYHLVTERFRSHRSASNKHDESVYQFIERRAGKELADILADTLTTERFSSDGKVISIRAGFAEIFRAEREYGSVTAGYAKLKEAEKQAAAKAGIQLSSRNYALSEGMQTLVEALQARLANPPVCEVGVTSLQPAAEGMQNRWVVQCTDGQTRTADIVVLACSIPKQSALVADLDNELSDFMLQIPVAGIISLSLAYSRQHVPSMVDNHSIVIPQKLNKDIHKIEFISSVLPDRAPSGKVFMRLTLGGLARKEMLSWEEDALILAARRELRNLLRITKPPQFCHIQKWPRAIPQYTLGHQGRVQQIMERLKRHDGLYLAGNGYYGVTLS
ncbi:MAG TPA: protoporphyrinogen oxidase, partial [Gemmatales bacterium]|nr:protoporphyrinogen oxidase [Gemmatales bacterium]